MNAIVSVWLTLVLQQPVVLPGCPIGTLVAVRVVPLLVVVGVASATNFAPEGAPTLQTNPRSLESRHDPRAI